MRNSFNKYILLFILGVLGSQAKLFAQIGVGPGPYCMPLVSQVPCNASGPSNNPGNAFNDFIDNFSTSGGNVNIVNLNSGCNTQNFPGIGNRNYINYGCTNFLAVNPGQVITFTLQTGIIFPQGFAIFIDWNQDNIFQTPSEIVAWNTGLSQQLPPLPASSYSTGYSFSIPPGQANGTYRMRVRCSYFIANGSTINPCTNQAFGEAEDYSVYVGTTPSGIITGTANVNSPVCEGSTFSLNVVTTATAPTTYTWSGPANYSTTIQNPVATATLGMGGVYNVTVANGACPIVCTTTLVIVPLPQYNVIPASATVCQGGSFLAVASTNVNTFFYNFQWLGPPTIAIQTPTAPATFINTLPLPATTSVAIVVYSIVVTPTALNCPVTTTMSVQIDNPATPTLTLPGPLCNTFPITFGTANPPGGTWYGNPLVASNGIINPGFALQNNGPWGTSSVSYSNTIGTCTAGATGNISVSQFQTAALTGTIPNACSYDLPFNLNSITLNPIGLWSGPGTSANTFTAAKIPPGVNVLTYYNPSTPYPNICPASNTMSVKVFNPPPPIIAPIPPKCTNAASVTLLSTPTGGVWSGNPGVSPSGIYTPGASSNLAGTNSVMYTAGQGTCVASSSATYHVSQFKSAALALTSLNMCVTSNSINLMSLPTSAIDGDLDECPDPNGNRFGGYLFI